MNNRCSRDLEALLRRTIFDSGEKLAEELRLTDVLRLLELSEELEEDQGVPLKAGWVRCPR